MGQGPRGHPSSARPLPNDLSVAWEGSPERTDTIPVAMLLLRLTSVLVCLPALLTACAGPRLAPPQQSRISVMALTPTPPWVSRPDAGLDPALTMAAVGVGATTELAKTHALAQLARQLSVRIDAEEIVAAVQMSQRRNGRDDPRAASLASRQINRVDQRVRTSASAMLLGARIDQVWRDPLTLRVEARAVISRGAVVASLAGAALRSQTEATEWHALAQAPGATRLEVLRRRARAATAAKQADDSLAMARAVAKRIEILRQIPARTAAQRDPSLPPAAALSAAADATRQASPAVVVVDPFAPAAIGATIRAALATLRIPIAVRAPAAMEIIARYDVAALGSDANGQQQASWRLNLEVRDAQTDRAVASAAFAGVSAGVTHADALVAASIASQRALARRIDRFLREKALGEKTPASSAKPRT